MATIHEILSLGQSGLRASKGRLQLAGFNIANANTPGYARRAIVLQAEAVTGLGVTMSDPHAVRNTLVSRQLNLAYAEQGFHEGQLDSIRLIQEAFNDLDGVGLGQSLNDFEDAMAEFAGNPAGLPQRQAVLSAAEALSASFSATREQVEAGLHSTLNQARAVAVNISSKAAQVNALNQRIKALTDSGQDIGGLVDQRTAVLNELASTLDIQAVPQADGSVFVYAGGGRPLVSAETSATVTISAHAPSANNYNVSVSFTKDNGEVLDAIGEVGGVLGGLISGNNETLGPTLRQLDELAFNFANSFNQVHAQGFDYNGNPAAAVDSFFNDINAIDGAAGAVHLATALIGNPESVAGSDNAAGVPGNNVIATALQDYMSDPNWGAPFGTNPLGLTLSVQDTYKELMVSVASAQSAAETGFSIESASVTQLETLLESESGVSVDEELINMTQANQAFEAASQVIRQADEMSDTTLRLLG